MSSEQLSESDQGLKRLEQIYKQEDQQKKGFWELDTNEVAQLTFQELEKLGIPKFSQAWEKVITHWSKCKQQGDNTNAERKPTTTGEVHVDEGTNSEVVGVTNVPSKRESD